MDIQEETATTLVVAAAEDMDDDDTATCSTTISVLSSTTEELFRLWVARCLEQPPNDTAAAVAVDALRHEACHFFRSLARGTQMVTATGQVLVTQASHAEALAVLIQQLEPAFAAAAAAEQPAMARMRALACLRGALQGCAKAGHLSRPIVSLLGDFLLQHCGPLQLVFPQQQHVVDMNVDDWDEQVRDQAVQALTALLQCPMMLENNSDNAAAADTKLPTIRVQLELAQRGVERRCAESVDKMAQGRDNAVAMGLSSLPRSRRSLCFQLVRAAVDAVSATMTSQPSVSSSGQPSDSSGSTTTMDVMVDFARFAAHCLHGESDPRCLLQLLQLLGALMLTWKRPLLLLQQGSSGATSNNSDSQTFPVGDVFDAVAPYYPIQFTPPPNDTHGITKAGLRDALLQVLCCCDYDAAVAAAAGGEDSSTMMNLTLGIILERLVPPPEDGQPATVTDWKEGLQDLQTLLLPSGASNVGAWSSPSRIGSMNPAYLQQVSTTLITVHHQSSNLAVSTTTDLAAAAASKEAANACRDLVAQIALETERAANDQLWKVSVADALTVLVSQIVTSSPSARISIAYVACLCSCGGSKTLRQCLHSGMGALIRRLNETQNSNSENSVDGRNLAAMTTTCVYGMGAFFSSTRVALDKAQTDGIRMSPHPLDPFTSAAINHVCRLLLARSLDDEDEHNSSNGIYSDVKVAAIRTLETILLVALADQVSAEQVEQIVQVIQVAASRVTSKPEGETENDWTRACAKSLGVMLGKALDDAATQENNDPTATLLQQRSGMIHNHLTNQVLTNLVFASRTITGESSSDSEDERFDRQTLALASTSSLASARRIVEPLVHAMNAALVDRDFETAESFAQTLGFLFQEKGSYAPRAFQQLAAPNETSEHVRTVLAASVTEYFIDEAYRGKQIDYSSSMDMETAGSAKIATEKALSVTTWLQMAYRSKTLPDQIDSIVAACTKCLPPHTFSDVVTCSIELCLLSAALSHNELEISKASRIKLVGLEQDLLNLALAPDFPGTVRSFAATCLYWVVLRYSPKTYSCPVESLIADSIMPRICTLVGKHGVQETSILSSLEDHFAVMGILGSAAAQRGGTMATTADKVIAFLVDLACTGKSLETFGDGSEDTPQKTVDLSFLPVSPGVSSSLSIRAASALGSMLSTESGSRLWKQRATHISSKRIQQNWSSTTELSNGMIAAVCHVVCGANLISIPATDLKGFAQVILRGLAPRSAPILKHDAASIAKLLLVSLVKLLSIVPAALKDFAYPVITGSMRAYALADRFEPGDALACKLLALQTLEAATHIVGASHILKESSAPVVSILGAAMNHPSSLLRQAAVEVRNAWLLLE